MEIINEIFYSFGISTGWLGVILGVVLFFMGRHHGISLGARLGAEEMMFLLEENKYLRVKRRLQKEDGTEEVEYARYDE